MREGGRVGLVGISYLLVFLGCFSVRLFGCMGNINVGVVSWDFFRGKVRNKSLRF